MSNELQSPYEQLVKKLAAGKTVSYILPDFTVGAFNRAVIRNDRLERLLQGHGTASHAFAMLYLIYFEIRLFILTRGNRQLTGAALTYQVAYPHIDRIEREQFTGGELKVSFIGRLGGAS